MSIITQNSTTIYMPTEIATTAVTTISLTSIESDEIVNKEEAAHRQASYESYMMMYHHETKDGRYESAAYYQAAAQAALHGLDNH
jgi:hypothetical protein